MIPLIVSWKETRGEVIVINLKTPIILRPYRLYVCAFVYIDTKAESEYFPK